MSVVTLREPSESGARGAPGGGSRGGAPGTWASHAAGDAAASRRSQPIRMEPAGTHYKGDWPEASRFGMN